jgi:endonuclease-8
MNDPPDLRAMVVRLRRAEQDFALGEALLDQRLVAGIGNMWRAEALFRAGLSPWRRLREVSDEELERVLEAAAVAMRGRSRERNVYRRAGRPCRSCGAIVLSRPQGEAARIAYWCPVCQRQGGTGEASA